MRIILCGGGTAGHVSPALAVADEIIEQDKNCSLLFIGREGGRENEAVTKAGIQLKTLKVRGLIRSIKVENLKRICEAIEARSEAKKIIKEFRPDVVLGTGGYVCWPVLSAAHALGIPTALHESNAIPGLTTRLISKKCDIIFLNHKESSKHLGRNVNCVTVGNPLRKSFSSLTRENARRKLGLKPTDIFILSFGGSGGAEKINEVLIPVVKNYSSKEPDIKHIHATGVSYYSDLPDDIKNYNKGGCQIKAYIDDMPQLLSATDIAICRCGAMTISELCQCGVCSVLIPSPNVTDNHQFENARLLQDKDAAIVIEEKNLSADNLISVINRLKSDKNGRKRRAKNIKHLSTPNAAKKIVNELKMLKNGSL